MNPGPLIPEQAARLLATCNDGTPIDLRDRALLVLALETGMERMSLCGFTWDRFRKSRAGYHVARVPIKGGELHEVPLSDVATKCLEEWRSRLGELRKIHGTSRKYNTSTGYVFPALARRIARGAGSRYEPTSGYPISRAALSKIVYRRAAAAGLKGVHPHTLRETFIDSRMKAGLSAFHVAAVTGLKIYVPAGVRLADMADNTTLAAEARKATPQWLTDAVNGGQR